MSFTEIVNQIRYSSKSERLWEESPQCADYTLRYESEYRNEYGEPIFYLKEGKPNRVLPVLNPEESGFYNAYPGGLHIDQRTGEIDINASDTGIRYTVEFTPCGKQCVARTHVVISGIGYEGRIFSLSTSPPEAYISRPYLDGNPKQEVPRGKIRILTDGARKTHTEGFVDLNGLIINPTTGEINLKATIEQGALGRQQHAGLFKPKRFPENGVSKEFKIYYQLPDQSRNAVNRTTIRIHFYNTAADIPEELQVRVRQQRNSIYRLKDAAARSFPLLLGTSLTVLTDSPWEALAALLVALSSLFLLNAQASDNPYRPPEHVGTR